MSLCLMYFFFSCFIFFHLYCSSMLTFFFSKLFGCNAHHSQILMTITEQSGPGPGLPCVCSWSETTDSSPNHSFISRSSCFLLLIQSIYIHLGPAYFSPSSQVKLFIFVLWYNTFVSFCDCFYSCVLWLVFISASIYLMCNLCVICCMYLLSLCVLPIYSAQHFVDLVLKSGKRCKK